MSEPTSDPADPPAPPAGGAAILDDCSGRFQALRARLLAETNGEYLRFVSGLAPRYARTWRDIALGYLFLGLVLYGVGLPTSVTGQIGGMFLGAVAVGYGIAFLQLFLHEASHFHLARDRALNDRLCDAVISWQVGTTVRRYRPIHFAHHRYLGTRADTENSYFRPLGLRLVLETLTGVHALRILLNRRRQLAQVPEAAGSPDPRGSSGLLRGFLFHGLVAAGAYGLSGWPGLGAWLVGVGAFFPLFATVRQLLEHRSVDADPAADYTRQDHRALTRMFGQGPLASTFGGAGFNRHLLHHWEPQVAYTRLKDLERFLASSSASPILAARRSHYLATLALLWGRRPASRT